MSEKCLVMQSWETMFYAIRMDDLLDAINLLRSAPKMDPKVILSTEVPVCDDPKEISEPSKRLDCRGVQCAYLVECEARLRMASKAEVNFDKGWVRLRFRINDDDCDEVVTAFILGLEE